MDTESTIIKNWNQITARELFRSYLWHLQVIDSGCTIMPVCFVHPDIENDGTLKLYYDVDGDRAALYNPEQLDPKKPLKFPSYRYYFTSLENVFEALRNTPGIYPLDQERTAYHLQNFLKAFPEIAPEEFKKFMMLGYTDRYLLQMRKESEKLLMMIDANTPEIHWEII